MAIGAVAVFAAAPFPASLLHAQAGPKRIFVVPPLVALAIRDLSFGTVLPGIPSSVPVSDPLHTGSFEITGPATTSIRVEFVLPLALVAGGSPPLPVSFGSGDAFAAFSPHGAIFDPHTPLLGALGPDGQLFIRLGGTVLPAHVQAGGLYSATITMTVYNLGS